MIRAIPPKEIRVALKCEGALSGDPHMRKPGNNHCTLTATFMVNEKPMCIRHAQREALRLALEDPESLMPDDLQYQAILSR